MAAPFQINKPAKTADHRAPQRGHKGGFETDQSAQIPDVIQVFVDKWCPGAESNHRHEDFQSTALPLSYPGTGMAKAIG
jgi:hypothetical protein